MHGAAERDGIRPSEVQKKLSELTGTRKTVAFEVNGMRSANVERQPSSL
jgi:hypothetical protein